jgi:hypothetical protein
MMSSPVPTIWITLIYVGAVLIGPKIMEKRQPFKLTEVLILYNFAICILSGYLVYEVIFFLINKK